MPKVLILVADGEGPSARLSEIIKEAAAAVRFTEVDVRGVAPHQTTTSASHKALESPDAATAYDGVVLVSSGRGLPPGLELLLDAWDQASPNAFVDTIFAAIGVEGGVLLERLARLGGIIVTEARGELDLERRAKLLGRRVATVVEWVRHALNHEHAHHHHAH